MYPACHVPVPSSHIALKQSPFTYKTHLWVSKALIGEFFSHFVYIRTWVSLLRFLYFIIFRSSWIFLPPEYFRMHFPLWPLQIQKNYPQTTSSEDGEECSVASMTPQDYSNIAGWMCYVSGVYLIYSQGIMFPLLCACKNCYKKKGTWQISWHTLANWAQWAAGLICHSMSI